MVKKHILYLYHPLFHGLLSRMRTETNSISSELDVPSSSHDESPTLIKGALRKFKHGDAEADV